MHNLFWGIKIYRMVIYDIVAKNKIRAESTFDDNQD